MNLLGLLDPRLLPGAQGAPGPDGLLAGSTMTPFGSVATSFPLQLNPWSDAAQNAVPTGPAPAAVPARPAAKPSDDDSDDAAPASGKPDQRNAVQTLPPPRPADLGGAAPASAAAPTAAPAGPGALQRFGDNGGWDALSAFGFGLAGGKNWGDGFAKGGEAMQKQALISAASGKEAAKLKQQQAGLNLTRQYLIGKGNAPGDVDGALAASAAGQAGPLQTLLANTTPKIETPSGFTRAADGSLAFTPGGPEDPETKKRNSQATSEGTAAGTPDKDSWVQVDVQNADGTTQKQWVKKGEAAGVAIGAPVAPKLDVKPMKDGSVIGFDPRDPTKQVVLREAPGKDPNGPLFDGRSIEGQGLNHMVATGALTRDQAAEFAAGKTVTNPADGSIMFMTPQGVFKRTNAGVTIPMFGAGATPQGAPALGAPAAAPGASPGAPAEASNVPPGMIALTAPKGDKAPTEGQANAALYSKRMEEADGLLSKPELSAAAMSRTERLKATVPGFGNSLVSSEYQQAEQAQRNFVNAALRRESGAAIAESEFENARKQYFAQPGDGPDVLAQKAANRQTAIQGIRAAAGPAARTLDAATAASPASDGNSTNARPSDALLAKRRETLANKYNLER